MAFIIVAAGPMTASRMRTLPAGRVLACAALAVLLLMCGSVALGYLLARDEGAAAAIANGTGLDARRPEGAVVVDRIGELSGRLQRLEIEAAALATRLHLPAPKRDKADADVDSAAIRPTDADAPRGGPLLPVRGDTELALDAELPPFDEFDVGMAELEEDVERLQVTLDQMAGVLDDRDLETMAYPNRLPVAKNLARISSGYGVRHDPFTGRLARHTGLDIPAAHGTPIFASGGGRVVSAGRRGPYGNAVVIDHGDGMQTLYGHCSKLFVRAGELVMPQQKIAAVGSTGRSTGPHLHFEVIRDGKRVAPGQVLADVLARKSP